MDIKSIEVETKASTGEDLLIEATRVGDVIRIWKVYRKDGNNLRRQNKGTRLHTEALEGFQQLADKVGKGWRVQG